MRKSLRKVFQDWYQLNNERQKLQSIYMLIVFAALVAAGLLGLVNYRLGQNVLLISGIGAIVYLVNLVTWALFDSLSNEIAAKNKPPTKKK